MIEIDPTRWRTPPPWKHQIEGVRALVHKPALFIGDVPRIGKSRQVVDAACTFYDSKQIDLVMIVCPDSARGVWGDPKFGQIKRYAWQPSRVVDFHQKIKERWKDETSETDSIEGPGCLTWVITNYDFIRSGDRLSALIKLLEGFRFLLCCDESKALGNYTSAQSKAIAKLRSFAVRCVMLNGTPGEPPKIWSQFNILDGVLSRRYKSFTTFKWSYAEWGEKKTVVMRNKPGEKGRHFRAVSPQIGWKNLDKLSRIVEPWTIRRERKDCPEIKDIKIVNGIREVRLGKETWKMYQQLKREAIIELSSGDVYLSRNAGVRLMRLAQICSGHLGGFEDGSAPVRDFSTEKIDFMVQHLMEDCLAQSVIIWCRWVRERELLAARLAATGFTVHQIYGGQPTKERRIAETILSDGAERDLGKRYIMVAQPQAGGMSLDMSAASDVYRMSRDYSYWALEQSKDRPMGNAQMAEFVSSTDILACGPNGERSMDHIALDTMNAKESLARRTCEGWRRALKEE